MEQKVNTENPRTRKEKRPTAAGFFDGPAHDAHVLQRKAAKRSRTNYEARRVKKTLKTA